MFQRFTDRARGTVVFAQEEARGLHHDYIGTEHLLLGLLRDSTSLGHQALERLGVELEDVRSQVVRVVGEGHPGTLGPDDAAALRAIGIDLDEVRRHLEETFGEGALQGVAWPGGRRRRKRCDRPSIGRIPFTPRAKKVLELAVREATAREHPYIGTEHILLGLVRERDGLAAELLAERDVSADRVRIVVNELISGN
ncbi:MAG TPA: Clp protease N-terminal domain-containing protein [Actinomycetota bacterium]|nr:Clp protease N-terminal domain-containing protein [Actinomycetota bacterium]